MMDKTLMWARN